MVNEATATIEECSREIQIINAEIERLKEKKSSLNDLLSYYDVIRGVWSLKRSPAESNRPRAS